jgi:hypothetical protein
VFHGLQFLRHLLLLWVLRLTLLLAMVTALTLRLARVAGAPLFLQSLVVCLVLVKMKQPAGAVH